MEAGGQNGALSYDETVAMGLRMIRERAQDIVKNVAVLEAEMRKCAAEVQEICTDGDACSFSAPGVEWGEQE